MEQVLLSCLWIPLVGAVLVAATGRWPNLREAVTLVTSAVLFYQVLRIYWFLADGGSASATLITTLPGVGEDTPIPIALSVEPLGMLFALVASFLWIVTSIYAIGYMRGHHEENQTRFYVCFAIAISSALGVAFADNLFTLFVFYEVLTLSTYPLVTHSGTDDARRAGRVYLGILLFTSVGLQLPAIVWTWSLAGTSDFTLGGILAGNASAPVVLALYAMFVFGIGKAAVMPFHRWLPAAMVAPTPVSALLHAVAVVKAGVFSILKVTVYVFGTDLLSSLDTTRWLMWVAAATVLLASLVAMRKDNLKARLAYSTVSQLSYIVLGAMLASGWAVIGAAMHIVMHAFGKITLFFCAGGIMVASHKTEISQMRGLGWRMPFTMVAFAIASLSLIGLPFLGGMWSKWFLLLGAHESGNDLIVAVYLLSGLLSALYLLPVVVNGFRRDGDDEVGAAGKVTIEEAPWPCLLAIAVAVIGCLVLFWSADTIYSMLLPIAAGA